MKKLFTVFVTLVALVSLSACFYQVKSKPDNQNSMSMDAESKFHEFTLEALDGTPIDFTQYKGKKVLLVNVASKCGFTPQYAELQQLHEQHGDKVVILGFPANNFGNQEPGSSEDIAGFCQKNYGVTFQMFDKISVKGNDMHPLYQWLSTKSENGWNDQAPSWNFCKYLVDENGQLLKFYASAVKPMSNEIVEAIR